MEKVLKFVQVLVFVNFCALCIAGLYPAEYATREAENSANTLEVIVFENATSIFQFAAFEQRSFDKISSDISNDVAVSQGEVNIHARHASVMFSTGGRARQVYVSSGVERLDQLIRFVFGRKDGGEKPNGRSTTEQQPVKSLL